MGSALRRYTRRVWWHQPIPSRGRRGRRQVLGPRRRPPAPSGSLNRAHVGSNTFLRGRWWSFSAAMTMDRDGSRSRFLSRPPCPLDPTGLAWRPTCSAGLAWRWAGSGWAPLPSRRRPAPAHIAPRQAAMARQTAGRWPFPSYRQTAFPSRPLNSRSARHDAEGHATLGAGSLPCGRNLNDIDT